MKEWRGAGWDAGGSEQQLSFGQAVAGTPAFGAGASAPTFGMAGAAPGGFAMGDPGSGTAPARRAVRVKVRRPKK